MKATPRLKTRNVPSWRMTSVVCSPLSVWRSGLFVFPWVVRSGVAVRRGMLVVAIMASIGQAGHVSIVQIDVGGLG